MKKLLSLFLSLSLLLEIGAQENRVRLNQLGFYTHAPKIAIITGKVTTYQFYITTTDLADTVFSGFLERERKSAYSSTITRQADFSALEKRGSFVVLVPGLQPSYVFRIGDDLVKEVATATLKGFYYQRASMPLDYEYAGKWHRSKGHDDDVVMVHASAATKERPEGTIVSSPGGWYDAGDYNKYIVNSGITMGTLLSAYEDFAGYFSNLELNIPESGDQLPDILNEVLYNLRWMFTMQDPHDGGVYHKCTHAFFDGMVMPGVTKAPRYVVQKSTAAALDFAAVMAQASRVFQPFGKQLSGLADSCLRAAQFAFKWAEANPVVIYDQNEMNKKFKPAIHTGGYGDRNLKDEWLWASAELYSTTLHEKYLPVLKERMKDRAFLPSWGNVGVLGYYSLLRNPTLSNKVPPLVKAAKDTVIRMADQFLERAKHNAFATVMGQSERDFNWGGNANAANQGILLVRAFIETGQGKYLDAALSNMDYILGRNATGYSFITGLGSKTPMHPHHRQSEADGITEPVPGLMVGGPNKGMQDSCYYPFQETETAYIDSLCSFASNEIAINWNAPVAYLANAIESLKAKAQYIKAGSLRRDPSKQF